MGVGSPVPASVKLFSPLERLVVAVVGAHSPWRCPVGVAACAVAWADSTTPAVGNPCLAALWSSCDLATFAVGTVLVGRLVLVGMRVVGIVGAVGMPAYSAAGMGAAVNTGTAVAAVGNIVAAAGSTVVVEGARCAVGSRLLVAGGACTRPSPSARASPSAFPATPGCSGLPTPPASVCVRFLSLPPST